MAFRITSSIASGLLCVVFCLFYFGLVLCRYIDCTGQASLHDYKQYLIFFFSVPATNISWERKSISALLSGSPKASRHLAAMFYEHQGDQVNSKVPP